MNYRKRRLKKHTVELDITAFMNARIVETNPLPLKARRAKA